MKIHLTLNHGTVISATLADHRTAEDFVAMLPLTLTLHDLFRREKFGALPGPVSGRGTREQAYAVGDIVCWTAGPDLAILHRQDGQPLRGGFELLGRLDFGAELFAVPGPVDVTITLAVQPVEQASAAEPACTHARSCPTPLPPPTPEHRAPIA